MEIIKHLQSEKFPAVLVLKEFFLLIHRKLLKLILLDKVKLEEQSFTILEIFRVKLRVLNLKK